MLELIIVVAPDTPVAIGTAHACCFIGIVVSETAGSAVAYMLFLHYASNCCCSVF